MYPSTTIIFKKKQNICVAYFKKNKMYHIIGPTRLSLSLSPKKTKIKIRPSAHVVQRD
jgi:hypothetical protein